MVNDALEKENPPLHPEMDLQALTRYAPCILWQARIREHEGHLNWRFSLADESAAQELVPLQVSETQTYVDSLLRNLYTETSDLIETGNAAIRQNLERFQEDFRCYSSDGALRWLHTHVRLQREEADRWVAYGVCSDVTAIKTLEETLRHQALHDPLTHLPNRTLFMDRLTQALLRAARRKLNVAALFLDLDGFKLVNDSLGHKAGDQLLIMVGERLATALRGGDTIARIGGDEFILLIEEVKDSQYVMNVAQRIGRELQTPFLLDDQEVYISTSIGIATNTAETERAEDLMRNADIALYEAKSKGKACHAVYDPGMRSRAWRRMELGTDLRRALERREFQVFYQPVVNLKTGAITELEALLRWMHPELGLLAACEFIPLAEEIGLINPIGMWALETACRQTSGWQTRFGSDPPLLVSVNLSDKQFQQADLAAQVLRTLDYAGLKPPCLKLEIGESLLLRNEERSATALRELKRAGVRLAVDNFGAGYISLSHLKRFQVDDLKIDRSFIRDLSREPQDGEIISAIVAMANALNLSVSTEGIETEEQKAQLEGLGCLRGQGYLFSRPLSPEEMAETLSAWGTTHLGA